MKTMKQIPVIAFTLTVAFGLFAQTATKGTNKTAKVTESKEHTAIRTRYETKVKECEGGKPQSTDNPVFDTLMRRKNAELVLAQAKLAAVGKSEAEKESIIVPAEIQLHSCEESELLEAQLEHVDACVAVYRKTIDKKNADLTVRESEQVKACQSLAARGKNLPKHVTLIVF